MSYHWSTELNEVLLPNYREKVINPLEEGHCFLIVDLPDSDIKILSDTLLLICRLFFSKPVIRFILQAKRL